MSDSLEEKEKVLETPRNQSEVYLGRPAYTDGIHGSRSLEYIAEQADNGGPLTYQEATGAPIESKSPLGLSVGWITIIGLNLNQMIGTGVYSTPASILNGTGSVGLSLIYWFIGFIISAAGLAVYLELASYFPSRSGAEPVYLEQAFPRPRYFFPVTFAVQSVLLSFSSSNAIVASTYLFRMAGKTPAPWELKGVAIAVYSLAVILLIINNRLALRINDVTGIVKLFTLVFVAITGLVVLGGHVPSVPDPGSNFRDAFNGSPTTGYGLSNALYNITFSYSGYANAFNVMAEVKDPIKTIRRSAPASLLIVAILYMLANIAYFAAVPADVIRTSSQTVASVFFTKVFGKRAAQGLNFLVVVSSFGNLVGVLIGQSRMLREIGRQGVLPFPKFWASTRPFGTPLAPYLLKWGMTILMIVAPPAGDAFNFVVDLGIYPSSFFLFLMTLGIYFVRRQRAKLDLPRPQFKAWQPAILLFLAAQLFLLIMPWYPPAEGRYGGDVSFWYATYVVVGIAIIVLCAIYYVVWIIILPKRGGYAYRQTVLEVPGGGMTHALVKVPNDELGKWDAQHDSTGAEVSQPQAALDQDNRKTE